MGAEVPAGGYGSVRYFVVFVLEMRFRFACVTLHRKRCTERITFHCPHCRKLSDESLQGTGPRIEPRTYYRGGASMQTTKLYSTPPSATPYVTLATPQSIRHSPSYSYAMPPPPPPDIYRFTWVAYLTSGCCVA